MKYQALAEIRFPFLFLFFPLFFSFRHEVYKQHLLYTTSTHSTYVLPRYARRSTYLLYIISSIHITNQIKCTRDISRRSWNLPCLRWVSEPWPLQIQNNDKVNLRRWVLRPGRQADSTGWWWRADWWKETTLIMTLFWWLFFFCKLSFSCVALWLSALEIWAKGPHWKCSTELFFSRILLWEGTTLASGTSIKSGLKSTFGMT